MVEDGVVIGLESGRWLRGRVRADHALGRCEFEAVAIANARLCAVCQLSSLGVCRSGGVGGDSRATALGRQAIGQELRLFRSVLVNRIVSLGTGTSDLARTVVGASFELGESMFVDVDGVHSEKLLMTTYGGHRSVDTETWADLNLLDGGEVVHAPGIVLHAVSHTEHLGTGRSPLGRDLTKVRQFTLRNEPDFE